MAKKKTSINKSESGKSDSRRSKSNTPQDASLSNSAAFDLYLLIVIESITDLSLHNINSLDELKYPVDIQFRVELADEVIGVSQSYSIPDKEKQVIDYSTVYKLPLDPNTVLVEHPLVVRIISVKGKEKVKSLSQKDVKSSKSSMRTESISVGYGNILATDFIDLIPLLFGEIEIETKVANMVDVLVRLDGGNLKNITNLLYVTLQSIRNPPLELLTTDLKLISANLDILYTSDGERASKTSSLSKEEKSSVTTDDEWTKLYFGPGRLTSTQKIEDEPPKRYFNLEKAPPILSQYRTPSANIKSRDLNKLTDGEASPIYFLWNQIKRCILNQEQQNELMQHLVLKGEWMMEFYVMRGEDKSQTKHEKKTRISNLEEEAAKSKYFAKLDLSQLLHPGVNCTRVVAPLESETMSLKLSQDNNSKPSSISKSSKRSNKKEGQSTQQISFSIIPSDGIVRDMEGRPSYVTVTVELYTSLRQRKTEEQLIQSLSDFVNADVDKRPYLYKNIKSPLEALADYRTMILTNVHYLHDLYQEFLQSKDYKENNVSNQCVEEESFKRVLEESGTLDLLNRRMTNALTLFLRDTSCNTEFDLPECYYKLAEETQSILDEASRTGKSNPKILATCEELFDAACEASEDCDYELAQQYLFKRLYYYGDNDPDKWLDLAVFCLKHGDASKAEHALKTALRFNPRHRSSLVMLSTLLATGGRTSEAVLIFWCLITFHPRFYYGWFTFYCFFTSIENYQSAEYCLSLGVICINGKNTDEVDVKNFWVHDNLFIKDDDGFMKTAIYLMSLNLWQFAEMCLSFHRNEEKEETMTYLYYLSVCHYLQGKFSESNAHLKEVIAMAWNDEKCWNMMGHNLYCCREWERAEDCYQLILDNEDLQPSCHLTFYRMARIKLNNQLYDEAYKYFLRAVSLRSTPKAWLGLAKASYWMEQLDDALLAAREANRLDENVSETWAMYALVHFKKGNHLQLAKQCLSMASKCGNIDEDIKNEIFNVLGIQHEDTADFTLIVENWLKEMQYV